MYPTDGLTYKVELDGVPVYCYLYKQQHHLNLIDGLPLFRTKVCLSKLTKLIKNTANSWIINLENRVSPTTLTAQRILVKSSL